MDQGQSLGGHRRRKCARKTGITCHPAEVTYTVSGGALNSAQTKPNLEILSTIALLYEIFGMVAIDKVEGASHTHWKLRLSVG